MDCNREEAVRAKEIAEKKMESKDFVTARKIALKAQQLFPEVENISQMLIVCDVHCSAAKKLAGNDPDWYGILQVEKTADEPMIKKQFKKFALQLHPDKNKFSGAESAFKLIGEAQGILLDKEKRRLYDMRHGSGLYRPPHSTNWNVNTNRSHPSATYSQNPQPQRPPVHPVNLDPNLTFWTICPFCNVKFQYFKEIMLRSLRCQQCQKPFIAYDMHAPSSANFTKPVFPQTNNTFKVEVRVQQNFRAGNSRAAPVQNAGRHSTPDVGAGKVNNGGEKKRGRKRNHVSESEDSSDSESSSDSEEEMEVDENGDLKGGRSSGHHEDQNVRRSSRQKQHVSYKENLSDDDDNDGDNDRASKKAKGKRFSGPTEENGSAAEDKSAKEKEDNKEVKPKEGNEKECLVNGDVATERETPKSPTEGQPKKSSEDKRNADPTSAAQKQELESLYSYPDPDFNDFEKDRSVQCFAAGQIWAAYDNQDAMPRFYAKIRKVLSPGFQLLITWLEPDPDDANGIKWHRGRLPFACGKYKYGESDKTSNLHMFSHKITWEIGNRKDAFVIQPRKAEIWAIFKNWDIKWNLDPVAKRKTEYEFEYVEILSNFIHGVGIHVAMLSKVNGFVSLFGRTEDVGKKTILIPPAEILKFSHMIPSCKMKGDEREGVPVGSFELDTASLPLSLLISSLPPKKLKPMMGCDSDAKKTDSQPQPDGSSVASTSAPEEIEYPESQFHDFDAAKSEDKFQTGQVWALYSDEDSYPKYYCQIEKVDRSPDFKLHVSWLASSGLGNVIKWSDTRIPVCCGQFKVSRTRSQAYDSNCSFSHPVKVVLANKKNEYMIVPRKGEVWALYKNWNANMKLSDLDSCEYDVVEVLLNDNLEIRVLELERMAKYNAVFKPRVLQEGSTLPVKRSIPHVELLRFSHQIPAFRLTDEVRGKLRGVWELDPAAVPVQYFHSK